MRASESSITKHAIHEATNQWTPIALHFVCTAHAPISIGWRWVRYTRVSKPKNPAEQVLEARESQTGKQLRGTAGWRMQINWGLIEPGFDLGG